jgi:hypothetical protein
MPEPRVLALVCKNVLDVVEGDPARRAASQAVPPFLRAELQRITRVHWVPLRAFEELSLALGDVHGDEGQAALFRDVTRRLMDQPVFSALVSGALRLFGADARALAKIAPKGFDVIFKDCGALSFERDVLQLRGYPSRGAAFDYAVAGFRGAFTSFYDLTKTTGRVVVEATDAARGDATYSLVRELPR